MLELLIIIGVVKKFAKTAGSMGLNKNLWGFIGAISYYGSVLLMGLVIFPNLVISGVIPIYTESSYMIVCIIFNILTGIICCALTYQILKKQETVGEKDSIDRIENYLNKKTEDE